MEFILEQQAQMQAQQAQMQAQQAQMQAQQVQMQAQQVQMQADMGQAARVHQEEIADLRKLFAQGAKILVSNREKIQETDRRISALVDAQLASERELKELRDIVRAFIESLRKGGNGN